MNGFVQLVKNLVYLSKFSLKKTVMKFPYFGANLQYLYDAVIFQSFDMKQPKIYNLDETLNLILNTQKSLARFGDGEINIIQGKDCIYQKYDKKLAERLKEILTTSQENLIIGINYWYFHYINYEELDDVSKNFSLYKMPLFRNELLKYIDFEKQYCDANISTLKIDKENYYEKFKNVWKEKEIVVVACKNAIDALQYNIFDCAAGIDYVFVPNINSFEKYDEVYSKVTNFEKTKLIILMAGPLSKVLASDLTYLGYRALDLGHLAKGYDFVKRHLPVNEENAILFNSID